MAPWQSPRSQIKGPEGEPDSLRCSYAFISAFSCPTMPPNRPQPGLTLLIDCVRLMQYGPDGSVIGALILIPDIKSCSNEPRNWQSPREHEVMMADLLPTKGKWLTYYVSFLIPFERKARKKCFPTLSLFFSFIIMTSNPVLAKHSSFSVAMEILWIT